MKLDRQSRILHLLGLLWLLPESIPAETIAVQETQEMYSARFQALWQLQLDLTECGSRYATKRIHCLNETTLANVEPLFDDVICTPVTDNIMECNEMSTLHFVNSFSGVQYDCQGTTFPFTKVEYNGTGSYCNSSVTKSVANFLQVSPICDNNNLLPFDSYFQCGDSNEEVFLNGTYTCQSKNTFAPYSTKTVDLPDSVMYTDFRWGIDKPDGCFELRLNTSTAEPTVEMSAPPLSSQTNVVSDAPVAIPAGTIYSVKYVGRFQQILSQGCTKSPPVMILTCVGDIVNVETSHPSIVCSPETITLENGQNAMLCDNSCTSGVACKDIFETEAMAREPFGEIFFECQGESTDAVDGSFVIDGGTSGVCDGTDPDGFNLYLGQLGVSCPDAAGGHRYVIDDFHAECGLGTEAIDVGGNYTCYFGIVCGASPCSFNFEQTIVNGFSHQYPECISTNNGSPVPQVPPPELPVIDPGTYTTQFNARWFLNSDSSCVTNPSLVHANCTNGNIKLVESNVPCEVITTTTIECSDSGLGGSLIYECESNSQIPETLIRSFSGTASCESSSEQIVQNAIQLGIKCTAGIEELFAYMDMFVECGPKNHFGSVDSNFTCFSSVTVPGSDSNEYTIPDLQISTDFRWPNIASASDLCHTYQPNRQRQLMSFNKSINESDTLPHWLKLRSNVLLGGAFLADDKEPEHVPAGVA